MFKKILIANRGEIACRIIRTCRRLGIATVAVYSEADQDALFVRMADEAMLIGPAAAAQSYLDVERIVAACRTSGADAVHPGYGFLSERAAFAEALAAAGIVFIGPSPSAIRAMGDKIESKRLARAAGVSTVPGTLDPVADIDEARRVADEIGYPVMVKASAGGGGKGMRVVEDAAGLAEGLERAQSEARSSFGDDRVFIEKFVSQPRHIEIQVLADAHGNVVHLGERECSIQRRHQKVIEESPSPFLDAATRAAMGAQAVSLARAVDYASAGTVEFIVDGDRNFYFLEMNTRLQVEHPVTELVYGVDLVEQMIWVAAGERLGLKQDELAPAGWAIEARLYAEDTARAFLPAVGRLVRYVEPDLPGLRIDSGVVEGGEISIHYDPMIAKVVGHGESRDAALAALRDGLANFYIQGIANNLSFLEALLAHSRFEEGRLTTGFIAEEFGTRFAGSDLAEEALTDLAAVALSMRLKEAARAGAVLDARQIRPPEVPGEWVVELGDRLLSFEQSRFAANGMTASLDGRTLAVALNWRPGLPIVRATVDGTRSVIAQVRPILEGYEVRHRGAAFRCLVRTRRAAEFAARMPERVRPDTSRTLLSPMPGMIVRVSVGPGDEIKAGQELMVLEAMKMENVLRAEEDGKIDAVSVKDGDTVSADQVLLSFA